MFRSAFLEPMCTLIHHYDRLRQGDPQHVHATRLLEGYDHETSGLTLR